MYVLYGVDNIIKKPRFKVWCVAKIMLWNWDRLQPLLRSEHRISACVWMVPGTEDAR